MGTVSGGVEVMIDKGIYLVDDTTRTYRYLRRNLDWESLDPAVNARNKGRIDGYTRVFRDGRTKVFRYRGDR